MTERPHWSYSALTQYLRCPLQYYFQRILGLKSAFTPSGLVLGSSVHEALAFYHHGIQDGKPFTIDSVRATFLDAWRGRRTLENVQIDDRQTEDSLLAQGVGLIEAYLKEPPPQNIVAIEQTMIAPLHTSQGKILEKPMTSIIDLVTQEDGNLKITDLKTSSRAYSEFEATISLQATCYTNSIVENLGELPTFEYAVLVKTKTPRVQRLTTTRTYQDLARLGDLVQAVNRAVEAGIFYPIESPLNCSTCPFRRPCQEWAPTDKGKLVQLGTNSHDRSTE